MPRFYRGNVTLTPTVNSGSPPDGSVVAADSGGGGHRSGRRVCRRPLWPRAGPLDHRQSNPATKCGLTLVPVTLVGEPEPAPDSQECIQGDRSSGRRRPAGRSCGGPGHRRGRRAGRRLQWLRSGLCPDDGRDGGQRCCGRGRVLIQVPRAASPEPAPGGVWTIPVRVEPRRAGERARELSADAPPPRCLTRPTRLSLRRTRHLGPGHPAGVMTTPVVRTPQQPRLTGRSDHQRQTIPPNHGSALGTEEIKIHVLNVQSLLPKLPDTSADVVETEPHVLCYTKTNLRSTTPNRLVTVPGYSDTIRR